MIRRFLKGSLPLFVMSLVFAALTSLLDLVNPRIVGMTVDSVIGDAPLRLPAFVAAHVDGGRLAALARSHILAVPLLVLGVAAVGALCRYLFHFFTSAGAEKLVQVMRDELFTHILRLPFTWYSSHDTGDIIQRCTSDVETVKRFVAEQLTSLLRILVLILLSLSFMWQLHPFLTMLTALFIPIIVLYSLFFHRKIRATFGEADAQEGVLSAYAQENLTGVRVVRAFGRERSQSERFRKQNDIYTAAYMRLCILLSAFWSAGDFISGLQVLTVVLLGAYYAMRGGMSTGEYISFISYNAILVWPVRQLGRVISDMSKAGVSVDRIRQIMDAQPEEPSGKGLCPPMDGDIVFSDVSFAYQGEPVLKHVSFTIPGGGVCGILGGTGSGKSTLMYLLKKMYVLGPSQGCITIGGTDLRDMDTAHVRRNVGMVMQEPFLFSRTIGENIQIAARGGGKMPLEEQMRRAASVADLADTIDQFTDGYDTTVGERGVTLSGGQKQRTAIAQTLMTHAPILVFDDSLSAVDTQTDARIQSRLQEETALSTVILISHRISSLMNADRIIVLSGGEVEAVGTHGELCKASRTYRRICEIQNVTTDGGEACEET